MYHRNRKTYAYCDFFVNISSCPYDHAHWIIAVTSTVFAVAATVLTMVYLAIVWTKAGGIPLITKGVRLKAVEGTMALLAFSLVCTPHNFNHYICFDVQ